MSAVAATALNTQLSGRNVDLVVNDEYLLDLELEEVRQRRNRQTTSVHIRLWFQQSQPTSAETEFTGIAVKLRLATETYAATASEFIEQPEPSIVTVGNVLRAWITETRKQPDLTGHEPRRMGFLSLVFAAGLDELGDLVVKQRAILDLFLFVNLFTRKLYAHQ